MYILKRTIYICSFVSIILVGTFFTIDRVFSVENQSGGNKEEIDSLNAKISDKKKRVQQLEKSIADYKSKIEKKRKESASLSNQVGILDNRTTQVELDIKATQEKIDTLALEIEVLGLSIEDKKKVIARQQDMLGELLRTIQYNDNKKYIEIVASYDNFSDFYNELQYVKTVESNLGANARTLRLVREELEGKKEAQEKRKISYDTLQKELEEKRKDLGEQIFAKERLLAQTRSSELTFKTLVKRLKNEYQQTENEITGIEREIRRKLDSQDKLEDLNTGDNLTLIWPTQSKYITTSFRDPDYPYRNIFEHNALDIRSAQGTPMKAAASGYIARARYCQLPSCYAYVLIVHSNGISTLYGHLSNISVQEGDFVARGDIIGNSGAAPGSIGAGPFTTGSHLHFEVRKDGIPVNPLNYLIK